MTECGVCFEDKLSSMPRSQMSEALKDWYSEIDGPVCFSCFVSAEIRVKLDFLQRGIRADFAKLNEKLDELNEKLD